MTSLRALSGIFLLSAAMSALLAYDAFSITNHLLRESAPQALVAKFPSLSAALREGILRPHQALTFSLQWVLVPIEAALLLIGVLNNKTRKPLKTEKLSLGEWVGMAVVWCTSTAWILGSFSIIEFPTFINGDLIFSKFSSLRIMSNIENPFGLSIIAWLSAWCESAMTFFFLVLPVAVYRYFVRRQVAAV